MLAEALAKAYQHHHQFQFRNNRLYIRPYISGMKKLPDLIKAWKTEHFDNDLLQALSKLPSSLLPLKQVARFSGVFEDSSLEFSILKKHETDSNLQITVGIFYRELSSLCPCSGEEPEKVDGHCEMQILISKDNGATTFTVI
jgi:hypothetical protein